MDERPENPADPSPEADGSGEPRPSSPQSPASRGLRAGLFVALAAALLALAANDSWLLPALDADGVTWLYAAGSLASGSDRPRVPVASWASADSLGGLEGRNPLLPRAMAPLVEAGTRPHVAGLWFLAGSLALLTLLAGWSAGGAAGVEGGLLAGGLLVLSPLAAEAATALRPELLAAAGVTLQLGLMTYAPRAYPAHGVVAALTWVVHPAGIGAVAAAALWPFVPDGGPLAPVRAAGGGASPAARAGAAATALAPAALLLLLGPRVAALPSLPPVLGGGLSVEPLGHFLSWAGAGLPGVVGAVLGALVLAVVGVVVVADAVTTPAVAAETPWDHPRAPDLVASRARAAAWILALATALGTVMAPGAGLARPAILVAAPVSVLAAVALTRWIRRLPEARSWAAAGTVGLWLLVSGWGAGQRVQDIQEEGRGLSTAAWLESETIRWLDNRLPPGVSIYASSPHLVLIQTTRAARTLPEAGESLEPFGRVLELRPGVVVLTGADTARTDAFQEELGLVTAVEEAGARILVPTVRPADEEGAGDLGAGPPGR